MKANKIYQFSFKSEAGWMMMSVIVAALGLLVVLILKVWSLILQLWY